MSNTQFKICKTQFNIYIKHNLKYIKHNLKRLKHNLKYLKHNLNCSVRMHSKGPKQCLIDMRLIPIGAIFKLVHV